MREEAEKRMKAIDRLCQEIVEKYPSVLVEKVWGTAKILGQKYIGDFFLRVWKENDESVMAFALGSDFFRMGFVDSENEMSNIQDFMHDEMIEEIGRWIGK